MSQNAELAAYIESMELHSASSGDTKTTIYQTCKFLLKYKK
jgi:hypothetical protein